MMSSTRKRRVSIPAASACAGITRAIVTSSITTNSKPQNAAAPRKMAAWMLLRSISRISTLASWISCWTRRMVSSTARRARSIRPRRPFPSAEVVPVDSGAEARGAESMAALLPSFESIFAHKHYSRSVSFTLN